MKEHISFFDSLLRLAAGVQSRSFVILWTKKLYRRVPIEYPWSCCTIILFLRIKHLVLPKNIWTKMARHLQYFFFSYKNSLKKTNLQKLNWYLCRKFIGWILCNVNCNAQLLDSLWLWLLKINHISREECGRFCYKSRFGLVRNKY